MITYPHVIGSDDRKRLAQILDMHLLRMSEYIEQAKAGPYGQGEYRHTKEDIERLVATQESDRALRDRLGV